MKRFILYWDDGREEIVEGFTFEDAIARADIQDLFKIIDWEED